MGNGDGLTFHSLQYAALELVSDINSAPANVEPPIIISSQRVLVRICNRISLDLDKVTL